MALLPKQYQYITVIKTSAIFNTDSFVNCHDYENFRQVLDKIRQIEEDPDLWLKMVSMPCFKDRDYPIKKQDEFQTFLKNIFDQDLNDAYRRPLKFHVIRYSDDIKNYMNLKSDVRFQRFVKCKDNILVRLILKIFGK